MRYLMAYIILCILPFTSLATSESTSTFVIKGAGIKKCSAFTALVDSKNDDVKLYAGWLEGYLTAINEQNSEIYDITEFQSTSFFLRQIYKYCEQNEADNFYTVAKSIVDAIRNRSVTHKSKLIFIKYKNNGLFIYDSVLIKAKKELARLGYLLQHRANSSKIEAEEISSIKGFQKYKGIPVTGLPDEATLMELFYSNKSSSQ